MDLQCEYGAQVASRCPYLPARMLRGYGTNWGNILNSLREKAERKFSFFSFSLFHIFTISHFHIFPLPHFHSLRYPHLLARMWDWEEKRGKPSPRFFHTFSIWEQLNDLRGNGKRNFSLGSILYQLPLYQIFKLFTSLYFSILLFACPISSWHYLAFGEIYIFI